MKASYNMGVSYPREILKSICSTIQVVFGVKSEDLLPLEQFKSEILICKDGWVGFVRTVKAILTLR